MVVLSSVVEIMCSCCGYGKCVLHKWMPLLCVICCHVAVDSVPILFRIPTSGECCNPTVVCVHQGAVQCVMWLYTCSYHVVSILL